MAPNFFQTILGQKFMAQIMREFSRLNNNLDRLNSLLERINEEKKIEDKD